MDENCKAVVLTDHILDHLNRIDNKQDKIFEELQTQNTTLVRNTVSLEDHIKRTNLLERKMDLIEEDVTKVEEKIFKIKENQDKTNFIVNFLKPTKLKIKIITLLLGLIGGTYSISSSKDIQQVLNIFGTTKTL